MSKEFRSQICWRFYCYKASSKKYGCNVSKMKKPRNFDNSVTHHGVNTDKIVLVIIIGKYIRIILNTVMRNMYSSIYRCTELFKNIKFAQKNRESQENAERKYL